MVNFKHLGYGHARLFSVLVLALGLLGLAGCKAGFGASNDATLSRLAISAGNMNPAFKSDEFEYEISMGHNIETMTYNARTMDEDATMVLRRLSEDGGFNDKEVVKTVNLTDDVQSEAINIDPGLNYWEIMVTAGDGTKEYYEFTITREEQASSDASLRSLTAENTDLSLATGVTSYTTAVNFFVNSTRITATPTNGSSSFSSVTGVGGLTPGNPSDRVQLAAGGQAQIGFTVNATDGEATQAFTINISREASGALNSLYRKATSVQDNAQFGGAVAIDGNRMAIGAPNHDSGEGAVYVFEREDDSWALLGDPIVLATGNTDDEFGSSVDIDGNVIVIGAPGANGGVGRVYIMRWNGTVWANDGDNPREPAADPSPTSAGFGSSVAIYDSTIAVGAPGTSSNQGALHIYEYTQGNWVKADEDLAPEVDSATSMEIGDSLVFVSEEELLVGAPGATNGASGNAGGIVLLYNKNQTWSFSQSIQDSEVTSGDRFGAAVAAYNNTMIVGAPSTNSDQGTVYVYTRTNSDEGWAVDSSQEFSSGVSDVMRFGASVAVLNETMVAVGAPDEDEGQDNSGAVFVFGFEGSSWTPSDHKLKAGDVSNGDNFGAAIAADGSTLVVGAPMEDGDASGSTGTSTDSGVVFVVE